MSTPTRGRESVVRIDRRLACRLRVVAAQHGVGISQIVTPVIAQEIDKLERAATAKFRAATGPTRTPPPSD
jgi:hypothetical protein